MASVFSRSYLSPATRHHRLTGKPPRLAVCTLPRRSHRLTPPAATLQTNDRPAAGSAAKGSSGNKPVPPPALQQVVQEMETMGLSDTDLKSKPIHYFWVTSACTALLALLARGVSESSSPGDAVTCVVSLVLGYILADMATGLYHFGVDNYGSASTPVFGPQIDAFQGHHRRPWTITKRQFANNLQALARPVFFTILVFLVLPGAPGRDTSLSTFFACVMFSQQFHAWAHTPRPLLPSQVIALQDAGLLVSRKMHGAHHRPPFNGNYCIVSGICNGPMDSVGVFSWLERVIYNVCGVAPRSWSSSIPSWLEGGETLAYYEDGSDLVD